MLRMSKLTDYGTVVMTCMARDPQRVHTATELAAVTHVSLPTVSKLLKMLARARLLVSQRGPRGGYMLARSPSQISLAEVIAAIEGPLGVTECTAVPGRCEQESGCPVRDNWQRLNEQMLAALRNISLLQMTSPLAREPEGSTAHAPVAR